ncbi:hypothetical protein [Pedobacter psychrophilus]|nr:hypothetical protein [Pedobacter psychrophilus]
MTTIKEQNELRDKIIKGLEKSYVKMIEFKKQKNSVIVVMRDDKIVKLKP